MDDRSLLDGDETPTLERENVFDDAFEVDDEDMIADGFRPGYNHDIEGSGRQDRDPSITPQPSDHHRSPQQTQDGPSRSSTRKSRSQANPFASPEDADTEPSLRRTRSGNFAPFTHHSISSASSAQYARGSSHRFGAGGPTHPYAMYPQGTVARTPSAATASTARPQWQSTSQEGPRHPYALYPQGVTDDLDNEHEEAQNPVPVGFLGLGHSFQRRRGPDGEEQDIVGFFGHTEQLPPYTRYPEDGPEKAPLLGVPEPPTALHSRAPVLGTDPSMPLMHAHLQATPQSMTDETELQRQLSRVSRTSASLRSGDLSQQESGASEKSWKEKSWRERRKTRFCGIPFWIFCLFAGTLAFFGVILGAVLGGFVEGQRKAKGNAVTVVTTSLYDASFIATPTATAPAATGTFGLVLGSAEQPQAECLTTPKERPAWDCYLADYEGIAISINTATGANTSGASLYYQGQGNEGSSLYYGTQASYMSTTWSPFLLVVDNDDPQDGKAFYFQAEYDKVVVIPESALDDPSNPTKVRRNDDDENLPPSWSNAGPVALPTSKPWFCFWNSTFVEGFIYIKEEAKAAIPTSSYSSLKPMSGTAHPTQPSWAVAITATPSAVVTATITMPSTTCTYTGIASAMPTWLNNNYPNFNLSSYTAAPAYTKLKRDFDDSYSGPQSLAIYPNVVKVEERRIPGAPAPYCVKYQVLDDGTVNWVGNNQGEQIVVHLTEKDPTFQDYQNVGLAEHRKRKRTTVPGSCHCQWMSGE